MGVPRRKFGRQAEEVSCLAVGGGHLSRSYIGEQLAVRIIQAAIDEGITFLDNAWDYGNGESERRMGSALEGRRDKVFLMTKVCGRDRKTATSNLEDSLRRLRTDRIDLWQFHEVNFDNDPEWIFAPGGAVEAAVEAKQAGKVRYIGFTGHKSPHILLEMLRQDFEWDSCQMPVNVFDAQFRSFQEQVLPVLVERGIACLGMKSLGGQGQFVKDAGLSPEECRRWALSQPVATLVVGIESLDQLQQELAIARSFVPMSEPEKAELLARTRAAAADGRHEWFKTTNYFDAKLHLDQHGFPGFAEVRR